MRGRLTAAEKATVCTLVRAQRRRDEIARTGSVDRLIAIDSVLVGVYREAKARFGDERARRMDRLALRAART